MERLLGVPEAAELLGMTKGAVYAAVLRGEIPAIRLGKRRLRFRESDLEAMLQKRPAVSSCPGGKGGAA